MFAGCWSPMGFDIFDRFLVVSFLWSSSFFLFIPGVPSLYPGAVWWPWYPSRWRLNIKYIYIKIYAVRNYGSRTLFRAFHNSVLELFNEIVLNQSCQKIFVWCRRHHNHTVVKVSVDSILLFKIWGCSYKLQSISVFTDIYIFCWHQGISLALNW